MNEEVLFARQEPEQDIVESVSDQQKFLSFMIDDLRFGVPAEYVVDIITDHAVTYLPMVPDYIQGIINLRGEILPILDLRLRLGREPLEKSLVTVLNVGGIQLGILVDSVDQLIDIPRSDLLPMPTNNHQQLVSGMCSLPDGSGTMLVLECQELMPHD